MCFWSGPPQTPPLETNFFEVLRGVGGPKTHWGMCLLDKIMIFQGVKLTIQPLGVGYATRPKKAQNGGYLAFSPIYAYLALIYQPVRGDYTMEIQAGSHNA